jgi:hypothetical protein
VGAAYRPHLDQSATAPPLTVEIRYPGVDYVYKTKSFSCQNSDTRLYRRSVLHRDRPIASALRPLNALRPVFRMLPSSASWPPLRLAGVNPLVAGVRAGHLGHGETVFSLLHEAVAVDLNVVSADGMLMIMIREVSGAVTGVTADGVRGSPSPVRVSIWGFQLGPRSWGGVLGPCCDSGEGGVWAG